MCRDIEVEKGLSATKVFNKILWLKSLSELVSIYFSEGRDKLRTYIVDTLSL